MDAPKGQQTEVVDSSVVRNDVDDPRRASYDDKRKSFFFPYCLYFLSRESSGTARGVDVVGTELGKFLSAIDRFTADHTPQMSDERMTTWVIPPGPSELEQVSTSTVPRAPRHGAYMAAGSGEQLT
jgi:hypothetical protein